VTVEDTMAYVLFVEVSDQIGNSQPVAVFAAEDRAVAAVREAEKASGRRAFIRRLPLDPEHVPYPLGVPHD
jgi:hypothetical protein